MSRFVSDNLIFEDLKAAAQSAETLIHSTADVNVPKLQVSVLYAFSLGRKAINLNALNTAQSLEEAQSAVANVPTAVEAALLRTLPNTLLSILVEGGNAGLALLSQSLQTLGGKGSGNFGHAGRKGEVGGSSNFNFSFPTTDSKERSSFYHATSKENLSSIKAKGLLPGDTGSVSFMTTIEEAKWISSNLGKEANVLLRVPRSAVPKGTLFDVDYTKQADTSKAVSPSKIEVYEDGQWRRLQFRTLAPPTITGTISMGLEEKNKAAIAWTQKHGAELAKGLSKTTKDDIRAALVKSFEGGGKRALIRDILDAVGDRDRAELIARSESMRASSAGQRFAWKQAVRQGLLSTKEQKTWIATDGCCDECDELDGEVVDLDEQFSGDGEDGPPLHPRCRCSQGLVGKE